VQQIPLRIFVVGLLVLEIGWVVLSRGGRGWRLWFVYLL